jgi:hydrogenase maturation protease
LSAVLQQHARPGLGPRSLLFGIGNSGRRDDGLGWAFLDRVRHETGVDCPVEYRYQLGVEDAARIAQAERVIFVDAYRGDLPGGFRWTPCEPTANFEFTTHVLPPRGVLHYCESLYGARPRADLLMIQGAAWGLEIGLSPVAETHLERALRFFRDTVLAGG